MCTLETISLEKLTLLESVELHDTFDVTTLPERYHVTQLTQVASVLQV